jgi:hypothetical protein
MLVRLVLSQTNDFCLQDTVMYLTNNWYPINPVTRDLHQQSIRVCCIEQTVGTFGTVVRNYDSNHRTPFSPCSLQQHLSTAHHN